MPARRVGRLSRLVPEDEAVPGAGRPLLISALLTVLPEWDVRHVWPQVHRWQPLAKASSQNKTACIKRHVLMSRSTHDPNFPIIEPQPWWNSRNEPINLDHFIHHSSIPSPRRAWVPACPRPYGMWCWCDASRERSRRGEVAEEIFISENWWFVDLFAFCSKKKGWKRYLDPVPC